MNNEKSNIVIEAAELPNYFFIDLKTYEELKNKISKLEELANRLQQDSTKKIEETNSLNDYIKTSGLCTYYVGGIYKLLGVTVIGTLLAVIAYNVTKIFM